MATIVRGKNKNKPYTVRYYYEGRQRERSFRRAKEARDFMAKFEHDSREQIFVDMRNTETFADASSRWLRNHHGTPKTLQTYELILRRYLLPEIGSRRMGQVATGREDAQELLSVTLPGKYGLGASSVRSCHLVLNAVVNDAVRAGRLPRSNIRGLKLPPLVQKTEITFATSEQIYDMAREMPSPYGFSVYLMRGCGLRLGEALGADPSDIRDGTLRLSRQLGADGNLAPLKHRGQSDYRDIPVPGYVMMQWDVWPGYRADEPCVSHRKYRTWFNRARDAAGLPADFTPHTLRHQFASVCLAGGIPITDVSKWLGHRSIQVTYGIYGHLVPASWDRARNVLDEEWAA